MKRLLSFCFLPFAFCLLISSAFGQVSQPAERVDYKSLTLGATVATPPTGRWNISLDGSGNLVAKKPDGSSITLIPAAGAVGGSGTANQLAGWTAGSTLGALNLFTNVADTLTLKNGTNVQDLRLYVSTTADTFADLRSINTGAGGLGLWLRHTAPSAPVVALAGAGAGNVDNGAHRYKVTYVTASGETEASTASSQVTVTDKTADGKVTVTLVLGNGNVSSRNIYRTVAGDTGNFLLVGTQGDNTATSFTDNIADASLTTAAPSTNSTLDRTFFWKAVGQAQNSGFVFPQNTSFVIGTSIAFFADMSSNLVFSNAATGGNLVYLANSAAGVHKFQGQNSAALITITQAGLVGFGGVTSSQPGLIPSGTTLKVRLADNSADAALSALTGTFSSLTSGRVTFAGASGLLSDDADLTFATDTLTATKISAPTSVTIGGGTAITKVISATATLDFANLAAIGCEDLTMTVTGAALGDTVALGVPNGSVVANGTFSAFVSATDTVTVRFCTVVSGDPASGSFRATVIKF